MSWIFSHTKQDERLKTKPMYFGVELEMAYPNGDDETDTFTSWLPSWVSTEEDGTIEVNDDEYQLELQFHPATFSWWKSHRNSVERILDRAEGDGADSGTHRWAGLHVHVDNILTEEHLVNILHFIYGHPTYFAALSRRSAEHIDEYGAVDVSKQVLERYEEEAEAYTAGLGYSGCTCRACRREAFNRGDPHVSYHNADMNSINHRNRAYLSISEVSKQTAVSIWPNTVEFRLYAGTLDLGRFYEGLQLPHALMAYTNPQRYDCDKHNSLSMFRTWCDSKARAKRYSDLLVSLNQQYMIELEDSDDA